MVPPRWKVQAAPRAAAQVTAFDGHGRRNGGEGGAEEAGGGSIGGGGGGGGGAAQSAAPPLSPGAIAGTAIGVVVGVALAGVGLVYARAWRAGSAGTRYEKQPLVG